jgi:hypothetical protein
LPPAPLVEADQVLKGFNEEATTGIEPVYLVLQTSA